MHVLAPGRFVISDLAQEGARYAVSGMIRSKQIVSLGIACLQSSKSVLEIVEMDFPLDERKTMSSLNVAIMVVPFRVVGKGWMRKASKDCDGMRGMRMWSVSG